MIAVEEDGALRVIRLNRPDKANALTPHMVEALIAAFEDARDHPAVVLTGTGRVFCAGADLDAARAGLATSPLWGQLSGAVAALRGLSIAALNGTAAGGSLGMVMACDLRLAVPGAKVFYPVMKLGFAPPPDDPGRMVALIGPARAKMILLAGQKIPVEEARDWGLIDRICDDPIADAHVLTADALAAPEGHVQRLKAMLS